MAGAALPTAAAEIEALREELAAATALDAVAGIGVAAAAEEYGTGVTAAAPDELGDQAAERGGMVPLPWKVKVPE